MRIVKIPSTLSWTEDYALHPFGSIAATNPSLTSAGVGVDSSWIPLFTKSYHVPEGHIWRIEYTDLAAAADRTVTVTPEVTWITSPTSTDISGAKIQLLTETDELGNGATAAPLAYDVGSLGSTTTDGSSYFIIYTGTWGDSSTTGSTNPSRYGGSWDYLRMPYLRFNLEADAAFTAGGFYIHGYVWY
jgi:hypothetical protein